MHIASNTPHTSHEDTWRTACTTSRYEEAPDGARVVALPPETTTASLPAQIQHGRRAGVAVIGLGYVGLPTALSLFAAGHAVVGVDTSESRLDHIRSARVDLLPAQLGRLSAALDDPDFRLTADPAAALEADAVIICVPTPVDEDLVPDLRALKAACSSAVAHAVPGQLLVLTSTSYVGTTRELLTEPLTERGMTPGTDVFVAFAPERIDPGNPSHSPDRTPRVIGGVTPRCAERACALLAGTAPSVHRVDSPEAAEMSKLWENTFRAVNIALANELSENCLEFDLEPRQVIEAAATKPYGFMPFYPGPGVGGHCIPCDPHYLLWQLRARKVASPLVDVAMTAIAERPARVAEKAREALTARGTGVIGARVLILGIAYKPGVADLRESPALEIMDRLTAWGATVEYSDGLVPRLDRHGSVRHSVGAPEALGWDLVVVHTPHPGADLGWLADGPEVLDVTHRRVLSAAGAAV
ncbi:nucleotide sugar dehydrogenase [Streptomyces sp. NBC_00059]|uniref:nucleotide sugar dehydrogenase n=1 Tax=Streptomyces sp. NBC_00059 TaxID=2975635 RepID=UPI0022594849|nr:nucleotide sugar dehydrogenase [Streptomyces sp. NBC_00059]MCX5417436.1 nucleotide sugar dehydrogenase [Streptomyces sp. NBC_00059]